jgi:hypothetical protein
MSIAAIYHSVMVVSDRSYPDNLTTLSTYYISKQAVKCAWNFVSLLTEKRVFFKNDCSVTRTAGQILDWTIHGFEEETKDDFEEMLKEEENQLVSEP